MAPLFPGCFEMLDPMKFKMVQRLGLETGFRIWSRCLKWMGMDGYGPKWLYPLVNVYITDGKIIICNWQINELSMAIFNSFL